MIPEMKKSLYLALICVLTALVPFNGCGRKGPADPPDTTPPAIVATTPSNWDTNVAPNAALGITFSEPVDEKTIEFSLVMLNGGGSVLIPCTLMSYSGVTAVFKPDHDLEYNTSYNAWVGPGVKDLAGNAMTNDTSWSFTTGAGPDTTPPTVVDIQPSRRKTGVSATSVISILFSEPMDPATISSQTIKLSYANGDIGGSVSYNGATAAATFTPNFNLIHNTPYTVTVTTGVKDLAKLAMTDAFVSSFTTGASDDVTPPSITSVFPLNNALNVDVNAPISVTFSEPMNASTITPFYFIVSEGTSTVVIPGGLRQVGTTAIFTPINPLKYSTSYTVTIPRDVKDLAGNGLSTDYTWSFTTGAQAPDAVQPSVLLTFPRNAQNNVPVYQQIVALFSEKMLKSSVTPTTFELRDPNWNSVPGLSTASGAIAYFTPAQPLAYSTTYTAVIHADVTDLAGNPLAGNDATWSFTTEPVASFFITSTAGAGGGISPYGSVTISQGNSQSYTITPITGYHIADVLVDGSSVGAVTTYTFSNVTSDHTISASFAINTFTVAPSVSGGNGTISPATAQTVNYKGTTSFTLSPIAGYQIVTPVGGTCGGTLVGNTYTTNAVTADCTVVASFAISTFTVTPSVSGGNGTINPATAQTVNYNGTTSFTLTPTTTGYHIVTPVGGTCGGTLTGNTYTTNPVTASCTVIASFAINTNTIATSVVTSGTGTISPVNPSVNYGANQSFTITPAANYHVADVLVDGGSAGAVTSYTFTNVTTTHTISASFAINTFTITASAGTNGTITPSGPTTVNYGANQAFTFTPNTGYYISAVTVDGNNVGLPNSYTFYNVTKDHTIAVSFALGSNTITATAGTGGTITSGGTIVSSGASQDFLVSYNGSRQFTFTPNTGYRITDIQVDGSSQGIMTSYTFQNVIANHTISAIFGVKPTATVTLGSLSQTYDGTPKSATATTIPAGLNVTFTYNGSATPPTDAGNYTVVATVNDTNYQGSATGTMTIGKATATVTLGGLSQTYDGTPKSATATTSPSGLLVTFTYNGSSVAPTNAGNYYVVGTVNDTNYQGSATGTLIISKATPTITWANPAAITYGTALSATQLNATETASVPGTFAYTPAAGTVLNAGTQTLSVTFTPTNTTNYTTATASVQITVNKVTPTITWTNPAAIAYGTALSATQLNATASTAGSFVYTPAAGTVLNAGTWTLSVTFTPTDTANYTTATASVQITVGKVTPTITWTNPAAIAYGTALTSTQLNATASTAGSFVYTPAAGTVLNAGANQTLSVTFTPTDTANYTTATASVQITVNKVTPTITWTNPAAIAYGTALSDTQLNATASVPGSFVYTPAAGTVLDVGTWTLSVTFTPTDTANYTTATASVQITVGKATPTITWANPAPITYGTALSATQLNATASVPGTFAYTPAAGAVLNAGANQTLSVTFTPNNTTKYNTATASVQITVNKVTPTITWTNPAAIAYGTALTSTQLNATASTAGSFVYTPAAGTVLDVGTQTLSVTFTPTDTANYTTATASVQITVGKVTPTITWTNPAAIAYGTALTSTQLNATASTAGSFVYTPAAGTVLNAGANQTLSVTFTPTDTANYTTATASVQITVNKATPTITWTNPAAIAYGTALTSTQLSATASVPGTFAYTPAAGTVLNAGANQTLSVTFTPTNTTNYTTATASVQITVGKATPTITWANPAAITYGTALSATQLNATASTAGSFVYTPAAGTVLNAGTRTLSVTFTPTDTANYTTATASVQITVNKVTPTITWTNPAGIAYGTALSATQLNATASTAGSFVYTPAAGTVLNAGTQTLSVTFTPTDTANYTTATASVQINVAARPITVTADAQTKVYGAADPALTYTITSGSLAGGDTLTGSLTRVAGQAVGAYAILQGTLANSNYLITYISNNLDITARPITITADAQTKVYGAADPTLTYQITSGSLVGGDTLTGALTRDAGETIGAYAIHQGTLANSNYQITYVGANLNITARPITITADAKTKVYGDTDPALTYTITSGSLVNGDSLSGALSRDAGETVGTYAIHQGTLAASSNYTVTYVSHNLSISARTLSIKADPKTKVYGDADPTFTYQITSGSLINGDTLTGALTRAAGENAGTYSILQGSLDAGINYVIMYNSANLTITPAATTTTIDAPAVTVGNDGTVTVTVSSTAGTPMGIVSLSVDGGTAMTQALSGGSAIFTIPSPGEGGHPLSASYAAQGNFGASSNTGTLNVNPAP